MLCCFAAGIQEPVDQLPLTGNNPHDASNVFIHTADSGNGITHGAMAGLILSDLITGRDNPWAQLYSPTRKPIKAATTYIKHGIEMGTRYRRWLKGGDVRDIEDIPACKGAVVLKGLKYVACYKGEDGQVEAMTAVCPHLGAIIKWNESEQVSSHSISRPSSSVALSRCTIHCCWALISSLSVTAAISFACVYRVPVVGLSGTRQSVEQARGDCQRAGQEQSGESTTQRIERSAEQLIPIHVVQRAELCICSISINEVWHIRCSARVMEQCLLDTSFSFDPPLYCYYSPLFTHLS